MTIWPLIIPDALHLQLLRHGQLLSIHPSHPAVAYIAAYNLQS